MKSASGYTLVELLITVALLVVIAALMFPRILRSRIAANEAAAISSIREINQAETSYQVTYPTLGFAAKLADLGGAKPCHPTPSSACLVNPQLATGEEDGYSFTALANSWSRNGIAIDYTAAAAPQIYNKSGVRVFCSMSDNVIRYLPNVEKSTRPPDTAHCRASIPME
ncbi:MAG TPA: type II secretion system protein [Terriglobales bacterium]|nr:type II secretion system protein [Terriglobales bacterium]